MSACFMPTWEHEIAEVRVRRAWTGKLVVQIRRRVQSPLLPRPGYPPYPIRWEDRGLGPWRDADGNNASETADVSLKMRTFNFDPTSGK